MVELNDRKSCDCLLAHAILLNSSAGLDDIISLSALVATHRYNPLSRVVDLLTVRTLLLSSFVISFDILKFELVTCTLFLVHIIVNDSLPLAAHTNTASSSMLTN